MTTTTSPVTGPTGPRTGPRLRRWARLPLALAVPAAAALPVLVTFVTWPVLLARHQVRHAAVACVAGTLVGVVTSVVLFLASPSATAPAVGTLAGATVLALAMLWGVRDLVRPGAHVPRHGPGRATVPQ